ASLAAVRDDALGLVRVVPRHDRHRALGRAEVDRLVRYARRDEEEVAGLRDDRALEPVAVARLDAAFELVDRRFVPVVEMWLGSRSGRDDHEVHGEPGRPAGLSRDTEEVVEALPSSCRRLRADDANLVHRRDDRSAAAGHAHLRQRPLLELTHALRADPEALADLDEALRPVVPEAETRLDHLSLALAQPYEQLLHLLAGKRVEHVLVVLCGQRVLDRVAEDAD